MLGTANLANLMSSFILCDNVIIILLLVQTFRLICIYFFSYIKMFIMTVFNF